MASEVNSEYVIPLRTRRDAVRKKYFTTDKTGSYNTYLEVTHVQVREKKEKPMGSEWVETGSPGNSLSQACLYSPLNPQMGLKQAGRD